MYTIEYNILTGWFDVYRGTQYIGSGRCYYDADLIIRANKQAIKN